MCQTKRGSKMLTLFFMLVLWPPRGAAMKTSFLMQPIVSRKQKWTGKLSPETYFSTSNMGMFKTNYTMCLEYRKFALARLPSEVRNGILPEWGAREWRNQVIGLLHIWQVQRKSLLSRKFSLEVNTSLRKQFKLKFEQFCG